MVSVQKVGHKTFNKSNQPQSVATNIRFVTCDQKVPGSTPLLDASVWIYPGGAQLVYIIKVCWSAKLYGYVYLKNP